MAEHLRKASPAAATAWAFRCPGERADARRSMRRRGPCANLSSGPVRVIGKPDQVGTLKRQAPGHTSPKVAFGDAGAGSGATAAATSSPAARSRTSPPDDRRMPSAPRRPSRCDLLAAALSDLLEPAVDRGSRPRRIVPIAGPEPAVHECGGRCLFVPVIPAVTPGAQRSSPGIRSRADGRRQAPQPRPRRGHREPALCGAGGNGLLAIW